MKEHLLSTEQGHHDRLYPISSSEAHPRATTGERIRIWVRVGIGPSHTCMKRRLFLSPFAALLYIHICMCLCRPGKGKGGIMCSRSRLPERGEQWQPFPLGRKGKKSIRRGFQSDE